MPVQLTINGPRNRAISLFKATLVTNEAKAPIKCKNIHICTSIADNWPNPEDERLAQFAGWVQLISSHTIMGV